MFMSFHVSILFVFDHDYLALFMSSRVCSYMFMFMFIHLFMSSEGEDLKYTTYCRSFQSETLKEMLYSRHNVVRMNVKCEKYSHVEQFILCRFDRKVFHVCHVCLFDLMKYLFTLIEHNHYI